VTLADESIRMPDNMETSLSPHRTITGSFIVCVRKIAFIGFISSAPRDETFSKAWQSEWARPVDYTNLMDAQFSLMSLKNYQ